jgi:hypothetical protein
MMNPAEALSLQASSVIDEGAVALMRERPGLDYAQACRQFMAANPHAAAAYAGDQARFVELSRQARSTSTRMATLPAGGAYERRFRRGAPPRALSSRRIADRSELLPGEVACLKLAPDGSGGGLYAERIAA